MYLPPTSPLFPYTTLFRSGADTELVIDGIAIGEACCDLMAVKASHLHAGFICAQLFAQIEKGDVPSESPDSIDMVTSDQIVIEEIRIKCRKPVGMGDADLPAILVSQSRRVPEDSSGVICQGNSCISHAGGAGVRFNLEKGDRGDTYLGCCR